jgi:hypothetical protein
MKAVAESMGQVNTFGHGDGFDRCKRNHIHGTDARMPPLMLFHIDMADSHLSSIDQGILNRSGVPDQADDQAVMIFIRPIIEKIASLSISKASDNRFYHLRPSAFTEIGNAFNQLSIHAAILFLRYRSPRRNPSGLNLTSTTDSIIASSAT